MRDESNPKNGSNETVGGTIGVGLGGHGEILAEFMHIQGDQ
jgi:hypothetical protein